MGALKKFLQCGFLFALAFAVLLPLAHPAEEANSETAAESTPAAEGEDIADDTDPNPPADSVGGQMGEVSLEKFIPTEEISADGAVSFPVDI